MNKQKIIIIDIDGTILDSSYSIQYLDGSIEESNYNTYFRTLDNVKPISETINKICEMSNREKADLIFLTSRNCDKFACFHTMDFIERNFSSRVPNKINVLFRALGDERSSADMKVDKLKMLKNKYEIIAIFEDEIDVLNAYKNEDLKNTTLYQVINKEIKLL